MHKRWHVKLKKEVMNGNESDHVITHRITHRKTYANLLLY